MKRPLLAAMLAIAATFHAAAQTHDWDVDSIRDEWKKTITVAPSDAPIVEKLLLSWGQEFPTSFVSAFKTYRATGKPSDGYTVDYAPKNGFIEVDNSYTVTAEGDGNFVKGDVIPKKNTLQAVYWNLPSGNKLFGISIEVTGEIFANCMVAFYEYNAAKGTLAPRADIAGRVMDKVGDDTEIFVMLPKAGRDIKYHDYASNTEKAIKWNGNGF